MRSLLALTILSLTCNTFAAPVTRALRSEQGNSIGVRYDVKTETISSNKPSSASYASPLRAAVAGPQMTAQDQVLMILVNKTYTRGQCGNPDKDQEKVYRMRLQYNPTTKNFVASFLRDAEMQVSPNVWTKINNNYVTTNTGLLMYGHGYCYTSQGTLEVAVSINGVWQVDPLNGSHNFKVMF